MAGMYIHIPFCRKACHYCDFHFSTSLKYRGELLAALQEEMKLRSSYLQGEALSSIYLGGGTPSLLAGDEVKSLLEAARRYYSVQPDCEITLEANPDDLDPGWLKALRQGGVNRLSIGVQSFFDEDLRWMNRAHTADEAFKSIAQARHAGFENLTVDLIYGFPLLTDRKWLLNIEKVISLDIPHVSCYNLTVEDGTALAAFIKKRREPAPSSTQGARQFEMLINELRAGGFQHYEISNFCKEGAWSRHNTAYWQEKAYLGIGPSAHSYNGLFRSWNRANNYEYIQAIGRGELPSEQEELSLEDRLNERIMTRLRTMWGLDLQGVEADFGSTALARVLPAAKANVEKGWIDQRNGKLYLTGQGKNYADSVISSLFVT